MQEAFEKVSIKAIIPAPATPDFYTIYLLSTRLSTLLPVKIYSDSAENLMLAVQGRKSPRPHIHDTTRRIIKALKGKIKCALIHSELAGVFYTYLQIGTKKSSLEIDIKLTDGLAIALMEKAPIYVSKRVLNKCGIKIDEGTLELAAA